MKYLREVLGQFTSFVHNFPTRENHSCRLPFPLMNMGFKILSLEGAS